SNGPAPESRSGRCGSRRRATRVRRRVPSLPGPDLVHEQQAGHQGTSLEAGNLTRDEARRRARAIAVESCHVDLDLRYATDPIVETFRSVSTLRFTARPGDATHVDLIAPIVD